MSLEYLLQPLTVGGRCGVSLLHEPEYDAIAAARHEDDPTLPRGVWTSELKRADWPEVVRLCEKALVERSKDLQLAAWLGEAWIALDGLAGGVRATQLLQGLCERFWEDLHPLPRGQDFDFRTAPFDWADCSWANALTLYVPLISGRGQGARSVTLTQWKDTMAAANEDRKKKKATTTAEKGDALSEEKLLAQLASMPERALMNCLEATRTWTVALEQMHATVDRIAPPPAPRLRILVASLADAGAVLGTGVARDAAGIAFGLQVIAQELAPPDLDAKPVTATAQPNLERLDGREDAYRQLGRIADFLAKADPHSPVPSLIRRSILWGRMPFQELLEELTKNNNEMHRLLLRDRE